jgi:photosystem II stability/assembly factor-like uncharacterized protein
VKAVSDKICWASGTGGNVLRTTDSGTHWQVIHIAGTEKLDFRDIEAPNEDAKTAIVMSSGPAEQGQAKIFKTIDGGEHWKEVFSTDRKGVFFDSIAFWDKQHGIGVSDPVDGKFVLFATENGGDTWHFLTPQQMPDALPGEGGFAASGTTIAVAGKHDAWFGTGGAKVSRVFHSRDNGKTWIAAETPIPAGKPTAGINGLAFANEQDGYAVGGDFSSPSTVGPNIAFTFDGGQSWGDAQTSNYLTSVSVCRNSLLEVGTKEQKISDADLNAASVAGDVAFGVGPHGHVFRMNLHDGRCGLIHP